MPRIKVLIVDDSTVIRRLLSDALATDLQLEVVGTAANGKLALAKMPQLKPDVVTLDIEMPEMDGIETLVELRKLHPKLPVVMFSTLTQKGAVATLEALSKGASDYVAKPANCGSVTQALEKVRDQLIPKLKALCPHILQPFVPPRERIVHSSVPKAKVRVSPEIIGIGSSTGGPAALQQVLGQLPPNFNVPILVTQHMPPVFTGHLAERLDQRSPLCVREAYEGAKVEPGQVWIATGDRHLEVVRIANQLILKLSNGPMENSCRPSVDVMFRSLAETVGKNCLGVVLTGMGQDGKKGCELIAQKGGFILVQDRESSVVWGMPRAVGEAGMADFEGTLPKIAEELCRLTFNRKFDGQMAGAGS